MWAILYFVLMELEAVALGLLVGAAAGVTYSHCFVLLL